MIKQRLAESPWAASAAAELAAAVAFWRRTGQLYYRPVLQVDGGFTRSIF